MRLVSRFRLLLALLALGAGLAMVAVDTADARRGGGFGSRGFRTFQAPAPTRTAPQPARPIDRSMTPRQQTEPAAAQRSTPGQRQPGATTGNRGGLFGGMAGGLIGGLMLGGLIGLLLGNGLGGLAGFLGLFLQVALIVLVVRLAMRYFGGQRTGEAAMAGASAAGGAAHTFERPEATGARRFGPIDAPAPVAAEPAGVAEITGSDEIGITEDDLDSFERLLAEIQAAFAREDYSGLRARCTPEIVSFLSEELSRNAVDGLRNDVSALRLLQGDLAEAWREGDLEYATVAMRYESVDVMRDRRSDRIVSGAPMPTETTEIWTFVRPLGGDWKLSAIQDA